ncbi:PucR family transcriptional regulator [Mariniluteicoccus flavus]
MAKGDNIDADVRQVLTNDPASHAGLPVRALLQVPALSRAEVIAGAGGLDRVVRRVNVMEVPDVLPWVHADQLLLTTGYPLRRHADLADFVRQLHEIGLAGLVIKLNRYLDGLPADMIAVADELDFPLVSLPDGVGFDEVLNQALSRVLDRRAEDLARSEQVLADLVEIVISGGDLGQVCHGLVGAMADAALVTTMDGRILAASTRADERVDDLLGLDCFDRTGRFRVEAEQTGQVTAAEGRHRLTVPVRARGRHEGRLVVFRSAVIEQTDVHMVEQAAAAAALVMTKEQAVAVVENKYRADFLRDALAGRAGPPERVVSHAASLGWDLDRPVAVVVALIDDSPADAPGDAGEERSLQERFARAWSQAVHASDSRAPVAGYSQEVVAIVGVKPGASLEDVTRAVTTHAKAVRGDGGGGRRPFTTGVSRTLTSIAELPQAYAEAGKAVAVGRRMHGSGSITHFDALGVFRLLSLVDPAELRSFAAETLGPLASDDAPDSEDLRRTLSVLLDHNLNVAETSRALHFHYNTLRYRITKLEQMLGPFTTDPHRRFSIALALHVVQMRGI